MEVDGAVFVGPREVYSSAVGSVLVEFQDTERGRMALRYAASLGTRLAVPMRVHVPYRRSSIGLLAESWRGETIESVLAHDRDRVRRVAQGITLGMNPEIVLVTDRMIDPLGAIALRAHDLVVDATLARQRVRAPIIDPKFECDVFRNGAKQPIVVPFGVGPNNGTTAFALTIARALDCPVHWYHTSWRDDAQDPANPVAHLDPRAAANRVAVMDHATRAGIVSEMACELAESVVGGMIDYAMRVGATMIVMARSPRIGKGSYVDRVLDASPMPVCVIPMEQEGVQ